MPEGQRPDSSLSRLDDDAKKTNREWMSSCNKKRKLDEAISEGQEAPATKSPKPRKGVAHEVIVIEDDAPLDSIQEPQAKTKENAESVKEIRVIVENLRDQVSDWTLRAQQTETSVAALLAKIGDGTAWKEDKLALFANSSLLHGEIARLLKRVEHLESNYTGCSCPHSRISSTRDPSKAALTTSTYRPDNTSTRPSTVEATLRNISSKTHTTEVLSEAAATRPVKSASPERAGFPLDVLSGTGISLEKGCWRSQDLSNKGLKELLQKVDFCNMAHLRALNALDDRATPRDCIMFFDAHSSSPTFQVDYILRTGTTATYINGAQHSSKKREKEFSDRGLKGLRVLELSITYVAEDPNNRCRFKEWKKESSPPKYVYDAGQLFVRRRGQGRSELFGTQYNLALDITRPRKPVWLVMRPEYSPVFVKKQTHSERPFSGGLNGVAIAKLANSLAELDFSRAPSDGSSYAMFLKAQNLIASTVFKGQLDLSFPTPDFDSLEARLVEGAELRYGRAGLMLQPHIS
ncbi:hypothetical protein DL762_004118 [Monosporascus cannonballus]|uniref:Uncharacterized protein n=1 Tax=Monosporascus cannonballus TaxID=155416 RepID=A0ABY0H984_9PEZI|nr:hypothetical protein DL762_004118 [Monosporascus cannonballus]RYO94359.1 hypothetical protein DL763_004075 [Monosporascus cannonballus]